MDNSYDKKTIYTFSIIGAHLVEIFYIHLYNEGEKLKLSKTAKTQTEGYKFAVHSFISSMNKNSKKYKPKFYNELLIGLTEYFAKYTEKPSLKLKGCVDMVVAEFVPSAYFQSASNEQRRFLFDKILNNGIKKLTEFIFGEFLSNIIDDHDNQDNVEKLKEYMIEIFSNERQNLYSELLVGVSNRQTTETMAIANYKTEIKKLKAELSDANKMISELTTICTERANGLKKAMVACRALLMKSNGKDDEIKLLNEKLERKQRELLDKEENTVASIQPNRYLNPRRDADQESNYYEQHNSDDEVVLISKDIPKKETMKDTVKATMKDMIKTPLPNQDKVKTPMNKQDTVKTPLPKQDTVKTPMNKQDTVKTPMNKQDTVKTPMNKQDTVKGGNDTSIKLKTPSIKLEIPSVKSEPSKIQDSKIQDKIDEDSEEDNESNDDNDRNESNDKNAVNESNDKNAVNESNDKNAENESNDKNAENESNDKNEDNDKNATTTQKSSSKEKPKELNYDDLSDIEIEDNIEMPSMSSFVSDDVIEVPKETKKNKKPKPKQEKPRTSSQMLERARYNIGNAPNLLDDY